MVSLPTRLWECDHRIRSPKHPERIKNHLNTEELVRIGVAALTAGGGGFSVLEAIQLDVPQIFPAPADTALAAAVLTLILETMRRLDHGQKIALPHEKRPL